MCSKPRSSPASTSLRFSITARVCASMPSGSWPGRNPFCVTADRTAVAAIRPLLAQAVVRGLGIQRRMELAKRLCLGRQLEAAAAAGLLITAEGAILESPKKDSGTSGCHLRLLAQGPLRRKTRLGSQVASGNHSVTSDCQWPLLAQADIRKLSICVPWLSSALQAAKACVGNPHEAQNFGTGFTR